MAKIYFFFYLLIITAGTIKAQEVAYLHSSINLNTNTNPVLEDDRASMIKGRVTTTDQKPAEMVNVSIKENGKSTMTDVDGHFVLKNIKEGNYTLQVSMIGLKTQEKRVSVKTREIVQIEFTLPQNQEQLSEIIVTSTKGLNDKPVAIGKIAIHPKDLPQSMTILDKGILDRQQVLTMSDALQNVNGVYIMGTTGGYQEEIAARGYSFGSNNTFKNGARFNNGIKPEFSSVESMEVLKGGNAILFGNVGAGGILNIVTKKPKFEQGGEISFRTGSYDLYKPSFDLYGAFNKHKKAAYRINGSFEKAGSFRDGVNSERYYFNPSLLFKLGAKTDLLLEGDYLKDERTPDFGIGAINYVIADVPRSRTLNVPWAYLSTEQYTATATATHHFNNNLDLRGIVSYQNFENELFGAARPASTSIKNDGKWLRGLQKTALAEDYYFASVDLNAKLKTGALKHTVLFGADADKYETVSTTFTTYKNPALRNSNVYDSINIFDPSTFNTRTDIPLVPADRITTSPVIRYGVYAQDLISISEKLKVLAGIRYSYQHNQRATVDTVSKNISSFIAATKNDAFSPRVGIVYQPLKTMSLFTSYTNTFSVNSGLDINGSSLEPSIIDQFEAGIKNDFFKGLLSANVTVYRIVNSNLAQTAIYLEDGTTLNTNSNIKELTGETTSKGVEVDIMTKPIKGFNIIAGYSYNDMRYTGVNGNTVNGNKLGDRLRYNPAHTANASIFYHFSKESRLKGFTVGAGAFYTGDRLAGRNPTNAPTNTNKLMPLPDFITYDANASYTVKDFSIRLKVANLFDKLSYNAHDDNSINPINPRLLAATFAYKF